MVRLNAGRRPARRRLAGTRVVFLVGERGGVVGIEGVAVVGHGGCGKTQLVSAMLFGAGTVNRLGKVDDGSTVTDLDFVNQGFNDANQIAFLATLADGRGGIYVASPVPEPGVGSLTSSALAMLVRRRRAPAGSPRAENPVRDAVTSRTAYPIRTELCAR